jgi:hypothetical protein
LFARFLYQGKETYFVRNDFIRLENFLTKEGFSRSNSRTAS